MKNKRKRKFVDYRTTSPQDDTRACLCEDNTYSRKCCDGSLRAQGIGSVTGTT